MVRQIILPPDLVLKQNHTKIFSLQSISLFWEDGVEVIKVELSLYKKNIYCKQRKHENILITDDIMNYRWKSKIKHACKE